MVVSGDRVVAVVSGGKVVEEGGNIEGGCVITVVFTGGETVGNVVDVVGLVVEVVVVVSNT